MTCVIPPLAWPDAASDTSVQTIHSATGHTTGGHRHLSRAIRSEAIANPNILALIGLARPPRLVSTFSLWRNVETMRAYARGRSNGAHPAATKIDRANPFHHESAFIRFRPYASQGSWDGRDPLAATA